MPTNKAGAIVLDETRQHVLLVHRLKKDDWSFPKGHSENEESPKETAKRETLEETGYSIQINKQLPDLLYKTDKAEEIKVSMFLATVGAKIQESEVGTESSWLDIQHVEKQLSYDNLREYWRLIQNLIS